MRPTIFALLLFVSCGGGDASPPTEHDGPRSLLLVTIDTLRADRLGCYGYGRAATPVIDGLAERGVRFGRVQSVAPLTLPAHTSIFTGTIPPYHGVRDNGTYRAVPELRSMAEILRESGRRTGAFTAAYVLDSQFGLDQGFEVYRDVPRRQIDGAGLVEMRPAAEVNADFSEWLGGLAPEDSFFAWVHYFEPHLPYPEPASLPPAFRNRPYDAEVAAADRALGDLLADLKQRGRLDDTLVVLTSDHGESLGEHGEKTHGLFVYQSTLDVPWIVAHPSLPQGAVITEGVSLVDVMPTVLELLGVEYDELPPPGRSLVQAIEGGETSEVPAYFEGMNSFLNYGWAPLQGVAAGEMKFIRAPRAELYDIGADPDEETNLYVARPQVSEAMESALDSLIAANERPAEFGGAQREPSAEDREALLNLGYVGAALPVHDGLGLADPKDGIVRIRREEEILAQLKAGRPQAAVEILQEILREEPASPVFNSRYGFLLLNMQRPVEALPFLRKSVEGGYRAADNLSNYGLCLFMTGAVEEARRTFEETLEIDRGHLPSLFWLAKLELGAGRPEAARSHLEGFVSIWRGGENPMFNEVRAMLDQL